MSLTPPIDLRHGFLFIEDGYGAVGAVNLMAGYVIGTVTMAVDIFTTALAVGDTFTLAGDPNIYTITAHTETSGHTTSITFTPGLVIAATDDEVITVLPHKLEVRIGEGNLQYTDAQNIIYVKNHGILDTMKLGEEETTKVNFDFVWDFLIGQTSEPPSVEEALTKTGNASTWVTTSTDPCQPYAVNLRFRHVAPCPGQMNEDILFPDFRWDTKAHDFKSAQVAVTGQSHRTKPTITRVAA